MITAAMSEQCYCQMCVAHDTARGGNETGRNLSEQPLEQIFCSPGVGRESRCAELWVSLKLVSLHASCHKYNMPKT